MPNDYDFDLDALAPQSKKIKFGGKVIVVQPPKTGLLIQLTLLGQRMKKKYETVEEPKPEEIVDMEKDLDLVADKLKEVIPEIKEAKLSLGQVNALCDLVIGMAVPKQVKELNKRGIKVDDPKKDTAG